MTLGSFGRGATALLDSRRGGQGGQPTRSGHGAAASYRWQRRWHHDTLLVRLVVGRKARGSAPPPTQEWARARPRMQTADFDDARRLRGLWLDVTTIERLTDSWSEITTTLDASMIEALRSDVLRMGGQPADRLEGRDRKLVIALEFLADAVVFDNLFVDARALRKSQAESRARRLPDFVRDIQISTKVYASAAEAVVRAWKSQRTGKGKRYLGESTDFSSFLYDDIEKGVFDDLWDEINVHHDPNLMKLRSSFVDTGGHVERVFTYQEIVRQSGVPARMSWNKHKAIEAYRMRLERQIQTIVEDHVRNQLIGDALDNFSTTSTAAPPLIDYLLRYANANAPISLLSAAMNIREGRETQAYRDWLWRLHEAVREPYETALKAQKLLKELDEHLDVMRETFDAVDRRTRRVKLLPPVVSLFGMSVGSQAGPSLYLPRHPDEAYVGFIARWFCPIDPVHRET